MDWSSPVTLDIETCVARIINSRCKCKYDKHLETVHKSKHSKSSFCLRTSAFGQSKDESIAWDFC